MFCHVHSSGLRVYWSGTTNLVLPVYVIILVSLKFRANNLKKRKSEEEDKKRETEIYALFQNSILVFG